MKNGKVMFMLSLLSLFGSLILVTRVASLRFGCVYVPQLNYRGEYIENGKPICNCQHDEHCDHFYPRCFNCERFDTVDDGFCKKLIDDDPDGWKRPFTGSFPDGTLMLPWFYTYMCNNEPKYGTLYTISPAQDGLPDFNDYTNRLQFNDKVVAQEGISFCIIGAHYRQSPISLWEPLRGFLPLAEKSFDIGNHIDPDDATRMNTVKPAPPEALRKLANSPSSSPWNDASKIPTWRYEHVLLGILNDKHARLDYGYRKRPAHPEWQPDPSCQNPYRVRATLIEIDGKLLHNYLHITVYTTPVSQSGANCPTGRIKYLMLEVRDQDGYPVGQFTDDVTCDKDEKTTSTPLQCPTPPCKAHFGTKSNHVPCMFSHPKSVVHPTIFMFTAVSGKKSSSGGNQGGVDGGAGGGPPDACRNSSIPRAQRNPATARYKENPDEYVTEVHTTWRFAQMDSGWVTELHFATMIIEDETPIQYYTSRLVHWDLVSTTKLCSYKTGECTVLNPLEPDINKKRCECPPTKAKDCCWSFEPMDRPRSEKRLQIGLINSCVNSTYNTNRPYGYSAQYKPLKPTFKTRGGWDYFQKDFNDPDYIDCHVEISFGNDKDSFYSYQDETQPDKLGTLPLRQTLKTLFDDKYTLTNTEKYKPPKHHTRYGPPSAYKVDHLGNFWGSVASNNYEIERMYEIPDWHNPGVTLHNDLSIPAKVGSLDIDHKVYRVKIHTYYGKTPEVAVLKMFASAHQDPSVLTTEFDDKPMREYFGSRYLIYSGTETISSDMQKLLGKHEDQDNGLDHMYTMEEMGMDKRSRCPCPFVPTTPPPELATRSPREVEGRRSHVINMLIAWVVLVPLSYFVARFYKETYARVYFLQEFWWYTIHVLCLLTALLFSFGALYALKIKRSDGSPYEIVWTDATAAHIYMGYMTLGIFIIHLLLGAFRFLDQELRIIQISLHWLFGWLEYMCAAGCIVAAAAIPNGIMSCVTFGIYLAFILYQVVFTLLMELHMRRVDDKLNLDPPRAYFPSPMMRLFHRDAPHAYFRVVMLAVYFTGCVLFYAAMHISINLEGGEFSCFQPVGDEE